MQCAFFPLVLVALAAQSPAPAQRAGQEPEIRTVAVRRPGYEGMVYHLAIPPNLAKGRRYPLVFALHDARGDAREHARTLARLATAELPVFVLAPQYERGERANHAVYPELGFAFRDVLEEVLAAHPVDSRRVVLEGLGAGARYAHAWSGTWFDQEPASFPFAALWLDSPGRIPRRKAPRIPHLLFAGAAEPSKAIRDTRLAYRQLFDDGADVRYFELPATKRELGPGCLEILRTFLARLDDWQASVAAGESPGERFAALEGLCLRGRFGQALADLDAILSGKEKATQAEKNRARVLRDRLVVWIGRWAQATREHLAATPELASYSRLVIQALTLAPRRDLGPRLERILAAVHENAALQLEIDAQSAFQLARRQIAPTPADRRKRFAAIAAGPLADTEYGRRARAHLLALTAPPRDK